MCRISFELAESEVKILLDALVEMERRMASLCDTSPDEDQIADVGNDLVEVRLLLKSLSRKAIDTFGEKIMTFSRNPL
jgi:hypothetical protein